MEMEGGFMHKVIVADDEPYTLEGWRTMIDWQACGYELCGTATDGEEALSLIGAVEPDLVVTDIQMPVLDGLGLIRTMREELKNTAKIVIATGYSEFGYAKQAIQYQVDEYVLKPLVTEEIHQILLELIPPLNQRRDEKKYTGTVDPGSEMAIHRSIGLDTPEHYDHEGMLSLSRQLLVAIEAGDVGEIQAVVDKILCLIVRSKMSLSQAQSVIRYMHGELLRKFSEKKDCMLLLQERAWHEAESWTSGKLKGLCIQLSERLSQSLPKKSTMRSPVAEAIEYLNEHYCTKIKLQDIAQQIHVNSAYLGQQFKQEVGVSFSEYIHRLRIEEARKLLRRTHMKISDIASKLGYHDAEYFTDKFKALTGELPSVYKNKSQG